MTPFAAAKDGKRVEQRRGFAAPFFFSCKLAIRLGSGDLSTSKTGRVSFRSCVLSCVPFSSWVPERARARAKWELSCRRSQDPCVLSEGAEKARTVKVRTPHGRQLPALPRRRRLRRAVDLRACRRNRRGQDANKHREGADALGATALARLAETPRACLRRKNPSAPRPIKR